MSVCLVIRRTEEVYALKAFGLRVAGALQEELEIWLAHSEKPEKEWIGELAGPAVAKVWDLSGVDRKRQILNAAKEEWPSLLIVGQEMKSLADDSDGKLATAIFESVACQVLAVRVSDERPAGGNRILVPSAGGRHSRRALKLAQALSETGTVAFQMRNDSGELSEEVGHRHLEKMIRKVGLSPKNVLTRVRLGEHFSQELRAEMEEDDYQMLLIGASGAGTLRRKLFGTLPERLLRRESSVTIAVIRAERSKGHRFREAMGRAIHVNIPQLNRLERLALFEEVEAKSRWNFDFAALMCLATAIAGMGLLVNSGAVVIGAMLVAPLMMPLIGTGLSLVQGNWPLARRALGAVGRGFCFAFALSVAMGFLARCLNLGMTEQLQMRGEPNSLDLGIAFVSGIAASYCIARPKLSGALAGVAIAAALVPPIATVGIGLALGQTSTALGAALLFGTNIVAIVLGAGLNFTLAGIAGNQKAGTWGRRSLIILVLICLGLAVPLTSVLLSRLSKSEKLEKAIKAELPEGVRLVSANRMRGGGFELIVESARPIAPGLLKALSGVIEEVEGEKESVKLQTKLIERLSN